jgi:outer membrane lipoprotein-sorting protein
MFSVLSVVSVWAADDATKILDKAASTFKAAGGVTISYTYDLNGDKGKGTIKMQGKKFVNTFADHVIWFNGKTLWTLVKENEEVNVTTPTPKELAGINPYSFLNMYKSGYKASMGKSTATYYEVILKAISPSTSMKSVVVHILKKNYQPCYVKLATVDGIENKISVTKYITKQSFSADTFAFNPKKYPNVDVVDLR